MEDDARPGVDIATGKLLDQMDRELPIARFNDSQDRVLFHYTNAAGMFGILRSRCIWATHYLHMNDRDEVLRGERFVDEVAEKLESDPDLSQPAQVLIREFRRVHQSERLTTKVDPYVISFSEDGNMLSQWRNYADGGFGYSLGFDPLPMPRADLANADVAAALLRVVYKEEEAREMLEREFRRIGAGFDLYLRTYANDQNWRPIATQAVVVLLRQAGALVPRIKHPAFQDEREWRMVLLPMPQRENVVQYRVGPTGVVPYIPLDLVRDDRPLPLKQLWLGPRQDERGPVSANLFLRSLGYAADIVQTSEIPFRG